MSCLDAKLLEIRDRATCIAAIAVRINSAIPENDGEEFLLGQEGIIYPSNFVLLYSFSRDNATLNTYNWGSDTRTMPVVHEELINNWDAYQSGDVIDVRYILKETDAPAESDRFYKP